MSEQNIYVLKLRAHLGYPAAYYVLLPEGDTTFLSNPRLATPFEGTDADDALERARREWPMQARDIVKCRRVVKAKVGAREVFPAMPLVTAEPDGDCG